MVYFWISIFLHFLGRIQDFTEGGLILGPPKVVPVGGPGNMVFWGFVFIAFKFEFTY